MKRIYLLLFAAALSVSVMSCEKKTPAEKAKDNLEDAGDNIKDAADNAGDATEKEAKKLKNKVD